jgi:hypothetical protein
MPGRMRLVVNLVGDAHHGYLAESRFSDKVFVSGGELNEMQLAFAAATAGHEVELRGWLHEPTFRRFAEAAGATPAVELDARRPADDDLVVVPEGWKDPLEYLQIALSPARLVLFVLAAPGLFGWDFTDSWSLPDPLTVDLETVALPEHFAAMRALGFELITHSPGIVDAAGDARYIGTGLPWKMPEPVDKEVDVVALAANRWAPLAREVARQLHDVDLVDNAPNDEILARMARARVLLWPSRIEGHATIPHEARSVGCVPVALSTNPFAVGLDEEHGAVVVDTVEELAPAVRALLADQERLDMLSRRAQATAREEIAWRPFVDRVAAWLAAPAPPDPGRAARAGAGARLRAASAAERQGAQQRLEDAHEEITKAGEDLTDLTARHAEALELLSRRPVQRAIELSDRYRRLRGRR